MHCCRHMCAGPLAVKAAIWTGVEQMKAHGWGLLYDGPVDSVAHVSGKISTRMHAPNALPDPMWPCLRRPRCTACTIPLYRLHYPVRSIA